MDRVGSPGRGELRRAADAASTDDIEGMTRPMLELLRHLTGMESTYLTMVDWSGDEQHVMFSLNTGELRIPEGLTVPWGDTLCRRSLEEDRSYTGDVAAVWGDSAAARELGIRTYVSVPVRDHHDDVIGTLGGASSRETPLDEQHLTSMRLFARVLADQLQREHVRVENSARAAQLEEQTRQLSELATRDELTGLLNRGGVFTWLRSVLPTLRPDVEQLAIAFVDVDDFKSVNDHHGHLGSDCAGPLGVDTDHGPVTCSVGLTAVKDPSVSAEAALDEADTAMYACKARHRDARPGPDALPARTGDRQPLKS